MQGVRTAPVLVLMCGLAALLTAAPARAEIIDRIMAVVSGRLILLSDVRGFEAWGVASSVPARGPDLVERLIDRELVLAEVERYGLPGPEPEVVQTELDRLRERTPQPFQQTLAAVGWTEAHLRRIVADNLRIARYLEERFGAAATPTDAEALAFYNADPAAFSRGGEVLPFDSVRELVRSQVAERRRRELIDDWIAGLRRRASISRPGT